MKKARGIGECLNEGQREYLRDKAVEKKTSLREDKTNAKKEQKSNTVMPGWGKKELKKARNRAAKEEKRKNQEADAGMGEGKTKESSDGETDAISKRKLPIPIKEAWDEDSEDEAGGSNEVKNKKGKSEEDASQDSSSTPSKKKARKGVVLPIEDATTKPAVSSSKKPNPCELFIKVLSKLQKKHEDNTVGLGELNVKLLRKDPNYKDTLSVHNISRFVQKMQEDLDLQVYRGKEGGYAIRFRNVDHPWLESRRSRLPPLREQTLSMKITLCPLS